ncbi:putative F-box protein At1g20800 isoform X1 [Capsella rubella]|uniref:putative F-box protein At1g20800 isoform X1 n=1 Tax=Capsella rubella TaxID=81985 RepID=UPI000CD527FB|nr:putative F-box protein At1g20800 isoform X1 [Capsella rubella]
MDSLPYHLLEEILFKLDPKSLVMMQCTDRSINSHITDDPYFKSVFKKDRYDEGEVNDGYDLRDNKWRVLSWIPLWDDGKRVIYKSKPSLSVDVDVDVTMVNATDDDKHISSSLSKIMRLISGKISPYGQSFFKKKEKRVGKRLMIEEETMMMVMDEPSSKFLDVERINKRRRVIEKIFK